MCGGWNYVLNLTSEWRCDDPRKLSYIWVTCLGCVFSKHLKSPENHSYWKAGHMSTHLCIMVAAPYASPPLAISSLKNRTNQNDDYHKKKHPVLIFTASSVSISLFVSVQGDIKHSTEVLKTSRGFQGHCSQGFRACPDVKSEKIFCKRSLSSSPVMCPGPEAIEVTSLADNGQRKPQN